MIAHLFVERHEHVEQTRLALQRGHECVGLGLHFLGVLSVELDQHQRLGFADDEIEIVAIFQTVLGQAQDQPVEQLGGRRLAGQNRADRRHGVGHRLEVQHDDAAHLWAVAASAPALGHRSQASLGANDQLREIEPRSGIHPRLAPRASSSNRGVG